MIPRDLSSKVFVLLLILIAVVYYVGSVSLSNAVLTKAGNLADIFTGRNPKTGQFANYPK